MIALITGANSGIGLVTAQNLADKGFDLILLVRSQSKMDETKAAILQKTPTAKLDFYLTDLENLTQVKQTAADIKQKYTHLDRIINNAGYAANQIEFNADGLEKSFVGNHLGHFVLNYNLLDLVENAAEGRIINVSSLAHNNGKVSRFFQKNNNSLSKIAAYGDGKLANLLFAQALAKRLKKATAYSLHPGVVSTNFGSNFKGFLSFMLKIARPFFISPEQGAQTTIYLTTAKLDELKNYNGGYFAKSRYKKVSKNDINEQSADFLWTESEKYL
jgi:retinol dehydrogenase 12